MLDIEALERTESAYENSEAYQNVFNANTAAGMRKRMILRKERKKRNTTETTTNTGFSLSLCFLLLVYETYLSVSDSGSRPLSAELREVMVRHERTKYLRVTQQLPVPERVRNKQKKEAGKRKGIRKQGKSIEEKEKSRSRREEKQKQKNNFSFSLLFFFFFFRVEKKREVENGQKAKTSKP